MSADVLAERYRKQLVAMMKQRDDAWHRFDLSEAVVSRLAKEVVAERARADAAEAKLAAVKDMPIVEERGSQTAEELLRNEGWNNAVFEMITALDEAVRKATS